MKKRFALFIVFILALTGTAFAQGVCVKPNAGIDQAPACSSNTAITTATLSATPVSGGSWSQSSSNPTGAVISNPSLASSGITGLNPGDYNFIWATSSTCSDTVKVSIPNCPAYIDLALKKSIDKKIAQIGDDLFYTIKVYNQSTVTATGIEVSDTLASTIQFLPGSLVASRGNATITGNVILWTIPSIAANTASDGDTVTLSYSVKAIYEGVHFNSAEISKTNELDFDSTPGNNVGTEDDIAGECFSVPFKLCPDEKVEIVVPSKYTNVEWFKDGGTTPIATGNIVQFGAIGSYNFTALNNNCPANGSSPVIIEAGDCCPAEICIPITVRKVR